MEHEPEKGKCALFISAALDDAGLSVTAFRVLCHLSRRLGKPGLFPGADGMARICRMERKTVFRALQELEQVGILNRDPRPGRTTAYTILPPETWGVKRDDPNSTPRGQTGRHPVGQTGRHLTQKAPHEGNTSKVIQEGNPSIGDLGLVLENAAPANSAPKKTGSKFPTTETAKRLATIFHRKLTTAWSAVEINAYKDLMPMPMEELEAVESYYAAFWPPKRGENILRTDLKTLLNNWAGEVDRANTWASTPAPTTFNW